MRAPLFGDCPVIHAWTEPLFRAAHVVLSQRAVPWPDDDPADELVNASDLSASDTRIKVAACAVGFHPYGAADIEMVAAFAAERVIAVLDDMLCASTVWSVQRILWFTAGYGKHAFHRPAIQFEVRQRHDDPRTCNSSTSAMTKGTLIYWLPGARWRLEFSANALRTFHRHVQSQSSSRESVGQLYSRDLTSDCIVVDEATVLAPTWAAWARVQFDPRRAGAERADKFKNGLHCVGLWHTHPEALPNPSFEDKALARKHALSASNQLSGLVFAIVGTRAMPAGLRVWIDDGETLQLAEQIPQ